MKRTASGLWAEGRRLNLERALKVGDELGGHIVTGHVDGIGEVVAAEPVGASTQLRIAAGAEIAPYIAAKGSVAIDGVSLTVNQVESTSDGGMIFSVNLIPHTAARTSFDSVALARRVNIEIDILARYIGRLMELRNAV